MPTGSPRQMSWGGHRGLCDPAVVADAAAAHVGPCHGNPPVNPARAIVFRAKARETFKGMVNCLR